MAYTTPKTWAVGDVLTAADMNTYVRDNTSSFANFICYFNAGTAPSGFTEFTTARGLFILGLVASGTLATAVGAALTDQQNVTHTHSVPLTGWGTAGASTDGKMLTDGSGGGGPPSGTKDASVSQNVGNASAGSIGIPYIQLLCASKSA